MEYGNTSTLESRQLDALENVAAELERLRLLKEYELSVRVVEDQGDPRVVKD